MKGATGIERAPAKAPCVMQCGRDASPLRVDGRDLCAHCFIEVVEIVSHEFGRMRRAAAGDTFTGAPDPELYTALGVTTLPGITAIARLVGAAHGERRVRDDPSPAMCDDRS